MANKPENPISPEEIFAIRETLGITQSELGRKIGVETTTISRWENGRATPNQYHDMKLKNLSKRAAA